MLFCAMISVLGLALITAHASAYTPSADVPPKHDVLKSISEELCETDPDIFVCKWVSQSGEIIDSPSRPAPDYLQVAGTTGLDPDYFNVGTQIVIDSVQNMPSEVFNALANNARVGLFTDEDETTIFPEYNYLRDTPECEGTCEGDCSVTCTGDGRKYDDLAGVGGVRATCVDDNYMCTPSDPYGNTYSVLIHEFGHTIHQYALSAEWQDRIAEAYNNAYINEIWDITSYGMSNDLEYFAEGAGVFFNVNFHGSSSGGMNGCGKPIGSYCESESEARSWLSSQDPLLYETLVYTFTGGDDSLAGGLTVCPE